MKQGTIMIARGMVYLAFIASLVVLLILLPELAREEAVGKPETQMTALFFVLTYILATPFFFALLQTHKLIYYIEKNRFFTEKAINAIRIIKWCAITFSVLVVITVITGMSFAHAIDPTEDITFVVTIGAMLLFASGVVSVFIAVFQKLLQDAVTLKEENDLIV